MCNQACRHCGGGGEKVDAKGGKIFSFFCVKSQIGLENGAGCSALEILPLDYVHVHSGSGQGSS